MIPHPIPFARTLPIDKRPITPEQLQGALRLKQRELELALADRRAVMLKVRMIKIEITALENRLAEQGKERVTL